MACSLWPSIKANRLELTPLGDDELWAAIVEPANRVGVTVDEALAVKLIADASGQKGVLPLVQETLVLLWDKVAERQLGLRPTRRWRRMDAAACKWPSTAGPASPTTSCLWRPRPIARRSQCHRI
jgi:hypothetical protein